MGLGDIFRRRAQGRRAVVIGLDGVPYTLLRQLMAEGRMPALAALTQEGALEPMEVTLPEISSVNWSSFMTGVNPARHGVFGFVDLRPSSYDIYFPNYQTLKSKTLWKCLESHGKRSVVANVPSTYPAQPINGVLISGFVALDLKKATYPSSLVPTLEKFGYELDADVGQAKSSLEALGEALQRSLNARLEVLLHLFKEEPHDLFIGVITETDRMHHYLWEAVTDPRHRLHLFTREVYAQIDRFLGQIYEAIGKDDLFMIMSDHGFCGIDREVYLNAWLRQQGYLAFSTAAPKSYSDIDARTRAFAMDPSRIYIHQKGKFPGGRVEPNGAVQALTEELREGILGMEVEGRRVVEQVYRKEEIYRGPYLDRAPDLVVVPKRGYDLKGSVQKDILAGNSQLTGMHTHDDAVVYVNRGIRRKGPFTILDIFPTLISGLGLDLSETREGTSLIET